LITPQIAMATGSLKSFALFLSSAFSMSSTLSQLNSVVSQESSKYSYITKA
jgi:hypothetical protein